MLRKVMHGFLKRFGSTRLKQHLWNNEYERGEWNGPRTDLVSPRADSVFGVIERFLRQGDILDLGCGDGEVGLKLASRYRRYVGVDISDVAVRKALSKVPRAAGRSHAVRFLVDDIKTFVPDMQFSVILFRESLYYLPRGDIEPVLLRYCHYLAERGVLIVRLHDRHKFKGIVQLIDRRFAVIERHCPEGAETVILVFAPPRTDALG